MMDNVWNVSKAPPLSDPIKFIFQQTNQRIINLLREEKPASIVRIGGSDHETYIHGSMKKEIYELNGYFDKELDPEKEKENFESIRNLYIKAMNNCNLVTVGGLSTLIKFGFVPEQQAQFSKSEKEFLKHISNDVPICHWDMICLNYENNFFLNVFPELQDKKICVISSFTDDIKEQLERREKLFQNKCENTRVGLVYQNFKYPAFKSVEYIKVPLCYSKYKTRKNFQAPFQNSMELYNDLCRQIAETEAEVYLVGAGMYANLLCDFIKEQGGIGINCGSSIQLFFGLLGNRFKYLEDQNVTNEFWKYPDLKKCIMYVSKEEMGGYSMDGIGAYTKDT